MKTRSYVRGRCCLLLLLAGMGFARELPREGLDTRFTQPDGTVLKLKVFGNTYYAETRTAAGYTVVFNAEAQRYEFALRGADGALHSSGLMAGRADPAKAGMIPGLRAAPEHRRAEWRRRYAAYEAVMKRKERWKALKKANRLRRQALVVTAEDGGSQEKAAPAGSGGPALAAPAEGGGAQGKSAPVGAAAVPPPTSGQFVGLTILVDFSDEVGAVPPSEIDNFCNEPGYGGYGNYGSVYDYFHRQSQGQLKFNNVVTTYVRMPQPRSAYNNTSRDSEEVGRDLLRDALDALVGQGFDFSRCTDDGVRLHAVSVFFAGGDSGVWGKGLWPTQWWLSAPDYFLPDGRQVWSFQMSNIGTSLELGTFCHETGHMLLDYPDFYDYDGDSLGNGPYTLMADSGTTHPVALGAYLRYHSGWTDTVELSSNSHQRCSVRVDSPRIYRYNNPDPAWDEYFLFENRQQTFGNEAVGDSGLLIQHCDENGDRDAQQMTEFAHYEVSVEQADFQFHLERSSAPWITMSGDLFHDGYRTAFSDVSFPNAKWWKGATSDPTTGTDSGLDAHSISANGETMTFVMGAGALSGPPVIGVDVPSIELEADLGLSPDQVTLFAVWNQAGGTLNYTLSDDASWLSLSTGGGTATTESDPIRANFNTGVLGSGVYNATITVSDPNAVNNPVQIPVSLTVRSAPSLDVTPGAITRKVARGNDAAPATLRLRNNGGSTLNYSVNPNNSNVSTTPNSGTVLAEEDFINLDFVTSGLPVGTYNATVSVNSGSPGASPSSVSVPITVIVSDLAVVAPSPGAMLHVWAPLDISWQTSPVITGGVRIDLLDGGVVVETISANTPNDGQHTWIVPGHLVELNDYELRITSVEQPGMYDEVGGLRFVATENFETGFGRWRNRSDGGIVWTRHTGPTPTTGTGPDAAGEFNYYAYVESSSVDTYKWALLEAELDLSSAESANISFLYHMYGTEIGQLLLALDTGTGFNSIWNKTGEQQTGSTAPWRYAELDLSAYVGSQVKVGIVGTTKPGPTGDIAIDRIRLGGVGIVPQVSLTVQSDHSPGGGFSPPIGVHTNAPGEIVNCTAPESVYQPPFEYVCAGWSLTDNEPTAGTTRSFGMSHTNDAVLTWLWQTNVGVQVSAVGNGTVTNPARSFLPIDSTQTVSAIPDVGYGVSWTVSPSNAWIGGSPTSTDIQIRLDGPVTVTATFEPLPVALEVRSAHGTASPPTGTNAFVYGDPLAASVTTPDTAPGYQYHAVGWTLSGNTPVSGTTNSFSTTITDDAVLTWLWRTNAELTVTSSGNGSVAPTGGFFAVGSTVALTATPDPLHAVSWTVSPSNALVAGTVTSAMIEVRMDGPVAVTATFAPIPVELVVVSDHGGTSPPLGTNVYAAGDPLAASVTTPDTAPGYQYHAVGWTLSGNAPVSGTTNSFSTTITNDAVLTWLWRTNAELTVTSAGNGSVDQAGGFFAVGSTVALSANADPGYSVVWNISPPEALVAGSTTSTTISVRLDGPVQAQASFVQIPRQLTIRSAHGSPSPPVGDHVFDDGTALTNSVDHTVVIAPGMLAVNEGWAMSGNAPDTGATNQFTMILTNDAALTWLWRTNVELTVSATGDGAVSPGGGFHALGSTVALSAAPDPGHEVAWSVSPSNALVAGTLTDPGIEVRMDGPVAVTATFTPIPLSLVVRSAHGSPSPPAGNNAFAYGDPLAASVTTPDTAPGYEHHAVGWTLSGNAPVSGTTNSFSTTITNDAVLTWLWRTNAELAVTSAGDGSVAPTGGFFAVGSTVALTATPDPLHAVSWTVNPSNAVVAGTVTSAMIEVRMDGPVAVTATFAPIPVELVVVSAHSSPSPPLGTNVYAAGDPLAASVTTPDTAPGYQYHAVGWTLSGNAPTSGTTNSFSTTITNDAVLTWLWRTNAELTVSSAGNGSVAPTGGFFAVGSTVALTATPDPLHAVSWTVSQSNALVAGTVTSAMIEVRMEGPVAVAATFAPIPVELVVVSDHGGTSPPLGTNVYAAGDPLAASVTTPDTAPGYQYHAVGWTLSGNAPVSGTTNSFSTTITNDAVLTWLWRTNAELTVTSSGNGSVAPTGGFFAVGSRVALTATPDPLRAVSWTVNPSNALVAGTVTSAMIEVRMDGPVAVTATFAPIPVELVVVSDHGGTSPPLGTNVYAAGDPLEASVTTPDTAPGYEYHAVGWTLSGNTPVSGTTNNFSTTITNDAVLTWLWRTNAELTVSAIGSGSVDQAGGFFPLGSTVALSANADPGYSVVWSISPPEALVVGSTTSTTISVRLGGPVQAQASFVQIPRQLTIRSAHGSPSPPVGDHVFDDGTALTNSVDHTVVIAPGMLAVNEGWAMSGNAPDTGATNQFTMTLTNDAMLVWSWSTSFWGVVQAGPGGRTAPSNGWWPAGQSVAATAVPDPGHHFVRWRGDAPPGQETDNPLTFSAAAPFAITAEFAPDPVLLTIDSVRGVGEPPVGEHSFAYGTVVTARMQAVVSEIDYLYRATATQTVLRLTQDVVQIWGWETNARVEVRARTGGLVSSGDDTNRYEIGIDYHPLDQALAVHAHPEPHHVFSGWTGSLAGDIVGATNSPDIVLRPSGPGDLVAVFGPDEHRLEVRSAHGNPAPPVGPTTVVHGTVVTATVESVVTNGDWRYHRAGWSLAGGTAGADGAPAIPLVQDEELTWHWRTSVWVVVDGVGGWEWLGTNLTFVADPGDPYLELDRWLGDTGAVVVGSATSPVITVRVPGPITLVPTYREALAPRGTPLRWLGGYGLTAIDESLDTDGDSLDAHAEWLADTIPTDETSNLDLVGATHMLAVPGGLRIRWPSRPARRYQVQICHEPLAVPQVWTDLGPAVDAAPPANELDVPHQGPAIQLLRIRLVTP